MLDVVGLAVAHDHGIVSGAVQLTFMDGQIAYWLSPGLDTGNNTVMRLFGHVVVLPMGTGACWQKLSAAQLDCICCRWGFLAYRWRRAIFPMLSKAASAGDMGGVKAAAGGRDCTKTLFLSLPASFGMILVAKMLVTLIYSGPKVTANDNRSGNVGGDLSFCGDLVL